MKKQLETEAAQSLRDTLRQISVIKVNDISRMGNTLIAHIEIYGHAHMLMCKIAENCNSAHLRRTFTELRKLQAHSPTATTPVLIAPELSEEAQALCRDSNTGFLDLEGNARLYLDEVFICKRSLPHHKRLPPQAESLPTSETAHFAQIA
jgi:hypothetical protein